MIRLALVFYGAVGLVATPTYAAQATNFPGMAEATQIFDYQPDAVINVVAAPNRQVTIEFNRDETINNVVLGDGTAWQAVPSSDSHLLFVKPMQGQLSTNMTVVTTRRTYLFELALQQGTQTPTFTVRFRYPGDSSGAQQSTAVAATPNLSAARYKLRGDKEIFPSAVGDDGTHIYLQWPPDVSMPAVFGVDETGNEVLVNGFMRGDFFVIDALYDRLVFRLGKLDATAQRQVPSS